MTGVTVTSSSCSGTCLTFSMPRQPNVSAVDSPPGRGGRAVVAMAWRTAAVSAPSAVEVAALMTAPRSRRLVLEGRIVLVGQVAGQCQEDLVQARLAQGELGDSDAG